MKLLNWQSRNFDQLSNHQLYAILKLRVDVFVVEQQCPYNELDNKDLNNNSIHLLGYEAGDSQQSNDCQPRLIAYARILPTGLKFPTPSIGRAIVHKDARRQGLGRQLIDRAISLCRQQWPRHAISLSAQQHLETFYQHSGFQRISDHCYLEDGIPHIDMICQYEKSIGNED